MKDRVVSEIQSRIRRKSMDLTRYDKVILVAGLVALPASLLYFNGGSFAYIKGSFKILQFEGVYTLLEEGDTTIQNRYNYLPIFAIVNAVILLPFKLLLEFLIGSTNDYMSTSYILYLGAGTVITGIWAYVSLLGIPWTSRYLFESEELVWKGTLVLITFPWLWQNTLTDQANTLVTLLALFGVILARNEKWFLSGVVVGLSGFKFTGISFALVLFFFVVMVGSYRDMLGVVVGGIVSQIPNLAYFAMFPDSFLFLAENRGGVSTHAWEIKSRQLFLLPVKYLEAGEIYKDLIFPILILVFGIIGAYIATKTEANLIPGFAVGYIPVSLLIPAEQNLLPFIVLTLIVCIPLVNTVRGKILITIVHVLTGYFVLTGVIGEGSLVLGMTSEHITYAGFSSGSVLLNILLQICIPVIFVSGVYLTEKRASNINEV